MTDNYGNAADSQSNSDIRVCKFIVDEVEAGRFDGDNDNRACKTAVVHLRFNIDGYDRCHVDTIFLRQENQHIYDFFNAIGFLTDDNSLAEVSWDKAVGCRGKLRVSVRYYVDSHSDIHINRIDFVEYVTHKNTDENNNAGTVPDIFFADDHDDANYESADVETQNDNWGTYDIGDNLF